MACGLYVGLEKYSCDMCGKLGERPKATIKHEDGSKADVCGCCLEKSKAYPKFQQGIKDGVIEIIMR